MCVCVYVYVKQNQSGMNIYIQVSGLSVELIFWILVITLPIMDAIYDLQEYHLHQKDQLKKKKISRCTSRLTCIWY